MEKTKFKIGDIVIYKIPMYESFLYQKATITKVFKNEKVKLEFRTLSGSLCKSTVEASELELF
jgi:hypothetical protein